MIGRTVTEPHHPRPQTDPITLKQLFPENRLLASTDVLVRGVTMNSRDVRTGDLYLAPPGSRAHGAQFAPEAVAAGAVAVVTDAAGSDLLTADQDLRDLPVVVVEDVRAAAGPLAAEVYGQPSRGMTVVGVTGTNGKTTMSYLIESVFAAAGSTTGIMGTTGHRIAGEPIPTKHTTPEAPVVHALLAVMAEAGVDAVVMEVSSHALDFGRVGGVEFDVGVFTNLTQDHLDFHGTMTDYFAAKSRLFDMVETAVICVDDQWGRQLAERHPEAITYSVAGESSATWQVAGWERVGNGSVAEVLAPDGSAESLEVPLPGVFNVANAVGTLAVAEALGIPREVARRGISNCTGVPGRMQPVANERGVHAFVDYAHTPDAVARAIEAAPTPPIVVLGCGGDRDVAKRPMMGAAAVHAARLLIVTDDNPRSEDPQAIRTAMIEGIHTVPAEQRAEVLEIGDRAEAIRTAARRAAAGDTVLVLGKGHEQGQDIDGVVSPFDDASHLRDALKETPQ